MQQDPRNAANRDRPCAEGGARYAAEDHPRRIRARDMLFAIRKRIARIVILGIIGLGIGALLGTAPYLRGEVCRQYLITTSIAVTSQNADGMFVGDRQNPSSADIYLAEDMVDAVIYVIHSDRTLNAAAERLNLADVSAKEISDNLELSQYNSTQIVELKLYWRSAQEGISILTAINELLPDILSRTLKIGSVSVINEPRSSYIFGGSLNFSSWLGMAALGVMMGVALAILELLIRPTLLDARDIERQLGLELLGEIPERRRDFRGKRRLISCADGEGGDPVVRDEFIAIAHMLQWQFCKRRNCCVAVTSAGPGEGKTTIAAHLALALSGLGMRVLLLDLDTRKPRLGGMFLKEPDPGHSFNALYRGEIGAREAAVHLTDTLDILPTLPEGEPLPIDGAMCARIDALKADYDLVLVDTAPVGRAAEMLGLSRILDEVLFVVRFDGASMRQIREALFRIRRSGRAVCGCIVNGVKPLPGIRTDGHCAGPHRSRTAFRSRKAGN